MLLTIGANDIHFSGLVGQRHHRGTHRARAVRPRRPCGDGRRRRRRFSTARCPAISPSCARRSSRWSAAISRASFMSPMAIRRSPRPTRPAPAAATASTCIPASAPTATRLREVAEFVAAQFLPKIKALALCEGRACRDRQRPHDVRGRPPARPSPSTASARVPTPIRHSIAIASRRRVKASTANQATAATDPMACGRGASEFRPYAPRARWVRTANDSYFTAMTYPQGLGADAAASEHPRRDLGRAVRGLWRRHPPDRRGPRRHGRCCASRRARDARPRGSARPRQ